MNQDINPIELVIKDISPSQVPAVVLPTNPSADAVSAALVLYFGLGKQGKQALVACPTPINFNIPGTEHVKSNLSSGGRNLVISFPYTDGSVDKVDYRIENNTFNLIVIPREGYEKITPEQINYSYQGGQPDTFITVGAGNLQSLGKLYQDNKQILDTLPLVIVNRQKPAVSFGSSEFTRNNAFLTELAIELLESLEIQIDQNIATVAFAGISASTNNFTSENTSAEVFELAGKLLRMGAQKRPTTEQKRIQPQITPNQGNQSNEQRKWIEKPKNNPQSAQKNRVGQETKPQGDSNKPQMTKPQGSQNYANPQKPVRPERFSNPSPMEQKPVMDNYEKDNGDLESTHEDTAEYASNSSNSNNDQKNETPQDWLKPKIFKGGGFI